MKPIPIYISSVEQDRDALNRLAEAFFRWYGYQVLSPNDIKPGDIPEERRLQLLETADVILILVSSQYLASETGKAEIAAASERRSSESVLVVPIIVEQIPWLPDPLARIEALPRGWNSVEWEWSRLDFNEIAAAVVDAFEARRTRLQPLSADHKPSVSTRISLFGAYWLSFVGVVILGCLVRLAWVAGDPFESIPGASAVSFFMDSLIVGIAAMSFIQIFRRIFRFRGAYHSDAVLLWLGRDATSELWERVGPGRIGDMFDLPSELLCGQLSAIADQALDQERGEKSTSVFVQEISASPLPYERPQVKKTETDREPELRESRAFAIQRNLDQFQITVSARWRRYLLGTSIVLSAGIFCIGLKLFHAGDFITGLKPPKNFTEWAGNFLLLFVGTVLAGLFGGFLGSIAHDFVAIIERLRR